MKKALLMLACVGLALLAALPWPAAAQEAQRWIDLPRGAGIVHSLLRAGDRLWLYTDGGLYELDSEYKSLSLLPLPPQEKLSALLSDGEKLWGLDTEGSRMLPLIEETGALQSGEGISLKIDALLEEASEGGEGYTRQFPQQALISGGRLYLLYESMIWMGENVSGSALLGFDLQSGEGRHYDGLRPAAIAAGRGGELLALCREEGGRGEEALLLKTIGPEGEKISELALEDQEWMNGWMGLLAFDQDSGLLCLTVNDRLFALEADGGLTLRAYIAEPERLMSGALTLLPGGRALLVSRGRLLLTPLDPALLPKGRVRIYEGYLSGLDLYRVRETLLGLPIESGRAPFDGTAGLGELLLLGEDRTEIFCLQSQRIDIERVKEKGYYTPLSGSEGLRAYVDGLDPQLRELAMRGDEIAMIPYERRYAAPSYHPEVFETLGLEPPQTFGQLCDLIDRWNDELSALHEGYLLVEPEGLDEALVRLAVGIYAARCERRGEAFSFESPVLAAMLERAALVRAESIEPVDFHYDAVLEQEHTLIGSLNSVDTSLAPGQRPLLLTAREGEEPYVSSQVSLMMLSPYAEYPEEALRFLETFVAQLRPAELLRLGDSVTEPVMRQGFEEEWENMTAYLASRRAEALRLEGAEKREMDANNEFFAANLDRMWRYERFEISEEMIALARRLAQNSYVNRAGEPGAFLEKDGALLLRRYLDGQLKLAGFLREAEQTLRLIQLENSINQAWTEKLEAE